jgi:hypothetical protein
LDEAISIGTYRVISYHIEKKFNDKLEKLILKRPMDFYNTLEEFFGSEIIMNQLEKTICSYLINNYGIRIGEERFFRSIGEGKVNEFEPVIKEYFMKKGIHI